MHKRQLLAFGLAALLIGQGVSAAEGPHMQAFVGQDLHLAGGELVSYQPGGRVHILVFHGGFAMSIGANQFSGDSAVVWLESVPREPPQAGADYKVRAYLEGGLSVKKAKGAKTTDISEKMVEDGRAMAVSFDVSGEVFVTAEKRQISDPRGSALYAAGIKAVGRKYPFEVLPAPEQVKPGPKEVKPGPEKVTGQAEAKEPKFRYPINLAGAGAVEPKYEWVQSKDGNDITTVIGRFYLWQKQDEQGGLLELQADNAVIFHRRKGVPSDKSQAGIGDALAKSDFEGVYLSGDVLMTEGARTIRADELYYDFENNKAIVENAVMRSFDATDGIPIYVRAKHLRQLAKDKFAANDVTVTTSEFHVPQISLTASSATITDTSSADEREGKLSKSSYDVEMRDVRFNMYDRAFFYWPYVRGNMQRPDTPLKSAHVGHDNVWGTMLEVEFYLARLLGLQEPQGVDSSLSLDYYTKRGIGAGFEVDYVRENYFGRMLGYVIDDHGEDRLGRDSSRRDLEPPRELRGRFSWQHRQFLPYNWQLTSEISYISDENFLESYYRNEYQVGKEQETLLHLKRIQDNWGLSFLSKFRINDFVNTLEELPSGAFHWTGQSFWDDRLTFYSDTQVSHFRQRYASSYHDPGPEKFFSFATTRNEVDMPLAVGRAKVVPFVAGTVAYEDGFGFYRELDGGVTEPEDAVWFGETGVRVSTDPYWKVYPDIRSRLWDLNGLRHVVRPYLTAVGYTENESVIEQRDALNVGVSQRLQTKRGSGEKERTVDWMRLDTDVTWVNDSADASAGPDRFIWNKPFIPMVNTFGTMVPQQDRRASTIFGPRRNSFAAEYTWRVSDTMAILSDMNFDIQSGVVQQFNIGFTRLCWPNLSYYIGSRYLRRVEVLDEKGSNAVTLAVTYVLDPRYTVVFAQQVDFDYGATVRSDITIIRRYHRIYWGLTFSADESLDERGVIFSVWPQGVPELGIGPKRYTDLGGGAGY